MERKEDLIVIVLIHGEDYAVTVPWRSSLPERGHPLPSCFLAPRSIHMSLPYMSVTQQKSLINFIPLITSITARHEWGGSVSRPPLMRSLKTGLSSCLMRANRTMNNWKPLLSESDCTFVSDFKCWISSMWCWHCAAELLFPPVKDVLALKRASRKARLASRWGFVLGRAVELRFGAGDRVCLSWKRVFGWERCGRCFWCLIKKTS